MHSSMKEDDQRIYCKYTNQQDENLKP